MVDKMIRSFCQFAPTPWVPMADVYEDEDQIVIVVDLAGIERDHLKIILEGRIIRIIGRRRSPCPSDSMRIRQMEIDSGEFKRRIALPEMVAYETTESVYKDGFLHIVMPKKATRETIQIPVETE